MANPYSKILDAPWGPNSFNFMQFLGKFGKIVCWRPPGELAPPPRGNPGSATGLNGIHCFFEQPGRDPMYLQMQHASPRHSGGQKTSLAIHRMTSRISTLVTTERTDPFRRVVSVLDQF